MNNNNYYEMDVNKIERTPFIVGYCRFEFYFIKLTFCSISGTLRLF